METATYCTLLLLLLLHRPLGALLDNVANGWAYNTVKWPDVVNRGSFIGGTVSMSGWGFGVRDHFSCWLLWLPVCMLATADVHTRPSATAYNTVKWPDVVNRGSFIGGTVSTA
jgi:hypothetical protein